MQKPIKRTRFRIFLGKQLFTLKRYLYWFKIGNTLARKKENKDLEFLIFTHKTPLLRKLKDVDMYLQHNKVQNLKIAIKKLDGIVLNPQEMFSYWFLVGKPKKSKGYIEGMMLDGGLVKKDIGGGLCQLSNLVYWMTLHSPLTVIERWRHSHDVFPDSNRTQPFGSGATCYYPYIDLQIKNATQQKFQFRFRIDDKYLIGELRSDKPINFKYELFEKNQRIEQQFWGDYTRHNEIYRNVFDSETGKKLKEELIAKNDAVMMYQPLIGE